MCSKSAQTTSGGDENVEVVVTSGDRNLRLLHAEGWTRMFGFYVQLGLPIRYAVTELNTQISTFLVRVQPFNYVIITE